MALWSPSPSRTTNNSRSLNAVALGLAAVLPQLRKMSPDQVLVGSRAWIMRCTESAPARRPLEGPSKPFFARRWCVRPCVQWLLPDSAHTHSIHAGDCVWICASHHHTVTGNILGKMMVAMDPEKLVCVCGLQSHN